MTLRLTNTLTRSTEEFVPLVEGSVSIYCCGVTVYDLCHLGHARSYIAWDVLRRYLIWRGYAVTFVQNFTDIDDKILARAAQEGITMEEVSERNIAAYFEDMDALHILRPDRMPRATRSLEAIRTLIDELTEKGAAYCTDGDVYFSVMGKADYGKLSGRDLTQQQQGASGRVGGEEEGRKRHPFDFALWKGAKAGEPSFPSPWGAGRPGWHIECSAMVREELGSTIDIHLGGADLIFPHHENEIAQSEAATGKPLARWWLHNGMVNVEGAKMAKSLGNFTTIRALLASGVSPMALRLFVLQAHYRKPLDFTMEALTAATAGWRKLEAALAVGRATGTGLGWAAGAAAGEVPEDASLSASRERFIAAMDDDLNTAAALGELFDLAGPLRTLASQIAIGTEPTPEDRGLESRWQLLVELAAVLGLQAEAPGRFAEGVEMNVKVEIKKGSWTADPGFSAADIQSILEERRKFKAARKYAEADRCREILERQGIRIFDKPGGITTATGGPIQGILEIPAAALGG